MFAVYAMLVRFIDSFLHIPEENKNMKKSAHDAILYCVCVCPTALWHIRNVGHIFNTTTMNEYSILYRAFSVMFICFNLILHHQHRFVCLFSFSNSSNIHEKFQRTEHITFPSHSPSNTSHISPCVCRT